MNRLCQFPHFENIKLRLKQAIINTAVSIKSSPRAVKKFFASYTVYHNDLAYNVWLWIIALAWLYNAIFIPMRASFVEFNLDYLNVWLILDYICDFLYLVDMAVKARSRFFQQGIEVYDTKLLYRHYIKSPQFIIDVVSILPTDLIYIPFGFVYCIARLNRLLRFSRFLEMTTYVEDNSAYPNVFRFGNTVLFTLLCILYTTVFYHSYSKAVGFADDEKSFHLSKTVAEMRPFYKKFMKCFFWGFMMITLIGEQNPAKSAIEGVIAVSIWILGLALFGVIVGRIGEILDNLSINEDAFKKQLDGVRGYLIRQRAPKDIYTKVVRWFDYAYEHNVLGSAEKALKVLPDKLREEMAMNLHLESLKKVPLFAGMEVNVLAELVARFKLQVFSPQDYVCRKGDIGREMYVVKSGQLEVVSDDGSKVFVTLKAGAVFGEISLLSIPGSRTGNKRTANVRSKGYSHLFSLSKEDLHDVLEDYSGAIQSIIDKGTEILRKENKLDEDAITRGEQQKAATAERFERLKRTIEDTEHSIAYLIASMRHSRDLASQRLNYIEHQMTKRYPKAVQMADEKLHRAQTAAAGYKHRVIPEIKINPPSTRSLPTTCASVDTLLGSDDSNTIFEEDEEGTVSV